MLSYARTQFECKAVDESRRIIAGYAAVHSNVDRVDDIIDPSASIKALGRLGSYGDVGVFIGHQTNTLPVGIPVKITADQRGLYTETFVFEGPAGDNLLAVAKGLQMHGKTLGMSIGYRPRQMRPDRNNGKLVRRLMDYDLKEYSFAAAQVIANPEALVVAVKTIGGTMTYELKVINGKHCIVKTDDDSVLGEYATPAEAFAALSALYGVNEQKAGEGDASKATWDTAYVNALPNSAFLYVEPGDDDQEGKRVPRSKRHFPIKDAQGNVDEPHLRAAVGRIPQADVPGLDDAMKRQLQARARRMLENMGGGKTVEEGEEWQQGAALKLSHVAYRLLDIANTITEEAKAMQRLGEDVKSYDRIRPGTRFAVQELNAELRDVVALAEYVDQDVDGAAENETLRAQLELLGV